nr:hypothetical protein CFP56_03668 [Quercus suber]
MENSGQEKGLAQELDFVKSCVVPVNLQLCHPPCSTADRREHIECLESLEIAKRRGDNGQVPICDILESKFHRVETGYFRMMVYRPRL